MKRLFALREARLYLVGQTLSLFGDTALFLMLGIWVKSLTHSNGAAGLVFFFMALPSVFSPLAGLVVDRTRRRPLMIGANVFLGCAVLLLLLVHDQAQVPLIYAVAVLYGVGGTIFYSAQSAFLRVMLPTELLGEANGVLQTVREGLRLVGPITGAGLYALTGPGVVAVLDAATFFIAIIFMLTLRVDEPVPQPQEHEFWAQVSAGARHIVRVPALRDLVFTLAAALLVVGFSETLVFAIVQGLHRPPSFFGVLATAQGVGAIVGGVTSANLLRRLGDLRLVGLGLLCFAVGLSLAVWQIMPVTILGVAVAGVGLPWALVAFGTALQTRTPQDLQGRVYSAADTLVTVPQTFSIALGAFLSTVFDYRLLLVVMAIELTGCAFYLLSRERRPVAIPTPDPV